MARQIPLYGFPRPVPDGPRYNPRGGFNQFLDALEARTVLIFRFFKPLRLRQTRREGSAEILASSLEEYKWPTAHTAWGRKKILF